MKTITLIYYYAIHFLMKEAASKRDGGLESLTSTDSFFPSGAPTANYGNQFERRESGGKKKAGTIEFETPAGSAPGNARLYFEVGVPKDIVGMSHGDDQMTLIYKENHGAPPPKDGKYNVKVRINYQGRKRGQQALYTGEVDLGVEDDHHINTNPTKLENVKYQNTHVIKKYKTGGEPIRLKGSYQDTPDKGVRFKLEIEDPDTHEWKKIFDHVDYGDDNHKINNYRRNSAYRSAIRIDGNAPGYDKKPLEAKKTGLKEKLINSEKSAEHRKQLAEARIREYHIREN